MSDQPPEDLGTTTVLLVLAAAIVVLAEREDGGDDEPYEVPPVHACSFEAAA